MRQLRSPLSRVVGLGSAKHGVEHWWMQRLTSIALVPLTIWFVVSLLSLPALDRTTVVGWMSQSWTALLLVALIVIATWHSQLGVRVVIEDYVHGGAKALSLVIVSFVHVLLVAAGVFCILKIAFAGPA